MAEQGKRWPVLAALAAGAALFAWLRDSGIVLQFQGTQMVKAAHALNAGRGWELSPGVPFAKFGPLYAGLLALGERAGLAVVTTAYLLNALTFAAGALGLVAIGRALGVRSTALLLGAWILWAPNHYLLRAVRPDAIPIAMSLLAVAGLLRYAREGTLGTLVWIALACSLATLARYMAAVTLLPFAALCVFLLARRSRLLHTAVFTVLAAGPIAAWGLRNRALTGYLTGMSRSRPREAFGEESSLLENLGRLGETLILDGYSFASLGVRRLEEQALGFELTAAGAVAVLAALFAAWAWTRRGREAGEPQARLAVRLCASFAAVYLAVLLLLWTVGNNDPINTRYVAPIYPFLLLLLLGLHARCRSAAAAAALVALGLAAVPNAWKSARLLGPSPGEELIEIRTFEQRAGTWRRAIDWADPAEKDR